MINIFITGASGCVGRYIVDELLPVEDYHLHLFIRDKKLVAFLEGHPRVTFHQGDMSHIDDFADLLATMDYIVHVATPWGDSDYTFLINVDKTYRLFELARNCKKIIYFSTASILGKNNQLLPEAGELGTSYIRSKYKAYGKIRGSEFSDKTVILFPTLVLGGAPDRPWSHVSGGIRSGEHKHYLKWVRFFYVDGEFHFIHAKDIATIVGQVIAQDLPSADYVMGYPSISAKRTIELLCQAFNTPMLLRVKLPVKSILFLAKLFGIKMAPWDYFCIRNPHFVYKTVTPKDFGGVDLYPTLNHLATDWRLSAEAC